MKKPWSITTTLRNPERLRDFLIVLKDIDGEEWNLETQEKYQILLIKYRKYGYGSRQFYKGLSSKQINLINDLNKEISIREAKDIFNAICEVTMLTGRGQWYNEGQPIMRHLRDFEERNKDKKAYCLFVAPTLHRDTLNTFWVSVKYEYEGKRQRIIPLSIQNFIELLKALVEIKQKGRSFPHSELNRLYDEILFNSKGAIDVNEWAGKIPNTISTWQKSLTA